MPGLTVTEKAHWRDRIAVRIDKAAEAVCGGRPWLMDPFNEDVSSSMRETYRHCHADAMARAVEKVDAPLVKQLNQPSG